MPSAGEEITQSGGIRNASSGRGGSDKGFFYFFKKMFIYLAELGLSGGMQYPLVVGGGI